MSVPSSGARATLVGFVFSLVLLLANGRAIGSGDTNAVEKTAADLAQAIPNAERLEVYGPADAPLALVRGRRRKRLLVRADRDVNLQAFLRAWLQRVKTPASVRLTVDVDPYSFL